MDELATNISNIYGERGRTWLLNLPNDGIDHDYFKCITGIFAGIK